MEVVLKWGYVRACKTFRRTHWLIYFAYFSWQLPTVRRSHRFWRSQLSARVERNWCIEGILSKPGSIRSISIHCFDHLPEELDVFIVCSLVIHTTNYFTITLLLEWKHLRAQDTKLKFALDKKKFLKWNLSNDENYLGNKLADFRILQIRKH